MGKQKPETLHDGRLARGLPAPNHMLPDEQLSAVQQRRAGVRPVYRWPLTAALRRATEKEQSPDGNIGLFVHPQYGLTHWSQWDDRPPTWMDPHLLLAMAQEDPGFRAALAKAYKQNTVKAYAQVQRELNRVFESQYLVWLIEEFRAHAAPLVAAWATNSYCQQQLDKPGRRAKAKS